MHSLLHQVWNQCRHDFFVLPDFVVKHCEHDANSRVCVVQMHNQAKSSMTSSLEKVQAGKEKKEQELLAMHQALEEANKKLQVCFASQTPAHHIMPPHSPQDSRFCPPPVPFQTHMPTKLSPPHTPPPPPLPPPSLYTYMHLYPSCSLSTLIADKALFLSGGTQVLWCQLVITDTARYMCHRPVQNPCASLQR